MQARVVAFEFTSTVGAIHKLKDLGEAPGHACHSFCGRSCSLALGQSLARMHAGGANAVPPLHIPSLSNGIVTKGIATRSKDATRGSWPYY